MRSSDRRWRRRRTATSSASPSCRAWAVANLVTCFVVTVVTLWLLLILMIFQYKSMVSRSCNHCHVDQWICYRGSAEKWQIHTQNSHFWRLVVTVDFDDISIQKVWSVDHVIIVMFINGYAIGGLQKCIVIYIYHIHFVQIFRH